MRRFVVENFMFGQEGDGLTSDQSFLDSGIIDSTGVLELLGFIEQKYAISVDDHELVPDNLDSIDRVASFVERKLNGRKSAFAG